MPLCVYSEIFYFLKHAIMHKFRNIYFLQHGTMHKILYILLIETRDYAQYLK